MKLYNKMRILFLFLMLFLVFSSCTKFSDDSPIEYKESVKELNGSWRIIKASRNGTDITEQFDFSKFKISFNSDKTYLLENYIPFLVKTDGTWSLDDPNYPFNLVFKENGSDVVMVSAFNYPIVNGKRQISLSFSPGCPSNIYTYVLEEVTNE